MGFTTSSAPGIDTFSNLINLMADPESVMAKLRELKEATDINQKILEAAGAAQGELALAKAATEKDRVELLNKIKVFEKAQVDFEKVQKKFSDKVADFESLKRDHEKVYNDKLDSALKQFNELKSFERSLQEKDKALKSAQIDIENKNKALDARESLLVARESKADSIANEYQNKLDKLKSLI